MAEEQNETPAATGNEEKRPLIAVQRIYVKDMSFESPEAPVSFNLTTAPQTNVELNTKTRQLGEDAFEVVLHITITAKHEEKVIYIAEIQQAGYFTIANVPEESMGQALGAFCPNVLFPYARATLDSLVNKGSFPSLMLAPINFDALYAQNAY